MFKQEHDSNVANWISEYPQHAAFIQSNDQVFGLFPPEAGDKEVNDEQWDQVTALITERNLASG